MAIPPTNASGEFHSLKARGLGLWKTYGPRASRRPAARNYVSVYGSLSKTWDLVAQSSLTSVLEPLIRANPSANTLQLHATTPNPHPQADVG